MSLSEELTNHQIILVVSNKNKYIQNLQQILTEIDKISNKICYVTLNKPYNTILMNIKSLNIDANKFFFVDAISATVQTPEGVDNCSFVSSPTALTDLSLAFSEALSNKECDNAVFDTISTLVVYQDINSVIKFVHNLITKIRVLNKKSIFVALKEDSEELIKDLNMFVDNVVEMNS